MPFRKNTHRENTLLHYWRMDYTVERAAHVSGIPKGSVSHYYARFNRDKERYSRQVAGQFQDPPRSSPEDVALASWLYPKIDETVNPMLEAGEYGKARDFLEVLLLGAKVRQKFFSIIQNYDPKQSEEIAARYIELWNFDHGVKNDPDGISILLSPELRQYVKALRQYIKEASSPTADRSTVTSRNTGISVEEMLKKRREELNRGANE